ncbi:MAG: trypsin-like peptidase domain-containing protein [Burkholderiales bacterium]|nr:MAG: trypsin-like peptidase domain-containing protein [Burkholderiales bacterium]
MSLLGLTQRLAALALFGLAAGAALAQRGEAPGPEVPAAPVSEAARDLLSRVRPAVVQIKGFFGNNTSQAFHGTGFAVAPGGVLITNYHVVAEQVTYPDKYRLEYRTPEGVTGKITVLAIDVRHDLAVVRAEGFAPEPLRLEPRVPEKGSRAFSIGFPLDVGLTITEGVSNGRVEDSFDPRIHYSGAINGGMSGGPAFNARGEVIGVNVSGYRFQQLVSFLVPAVHARELLARALAGTPEASVLKRDATVQLQAHATALLSAFTGEFATQRVAGYALPAKLTPFVDCSASGDPAPQAPVQTVTVKCAAKAGLFVQQGLYTGDLSFAHYVLSTDKLDAWRFSRKLSGYASAKGAFGSRRHVGPFACEKGVVQLQGFDASLLVCVRNYRRLEGLSDITVRVISLNHGLQGFASHLDMYGVEAGAGLAFVRRYVEAMAWQP